MREKATNRKIDHVAQLRNIINDEELSNRIIGSKVTAIWIDRVVELHLKAEVLNVTSITSSGGVKLAYIFVLNMLYFVLNYLFCPNFAFCLCKSSRKSRATVIFRFC